MICICGKPAVLMNSFPFTTLEEMEKQMIRKALEKNNGNFTAAADQLGLPGKRFTINLKNPEMISRNLYINIVLRVLLIVILSDSAWVFCLYDKVGPFVINLFNALLFCNYQPDLLSEHNKQENEVFLRFCQK